MTRTTRPADPATKQPRTSTLDRETLLRLAPTEYERFAEMLCTLHADDWTRATECPDWDVRAMAGHVLGMAQMAASIREMIRQQMAAKKRGGVPIDALTGLQVEKNAHLSTEQLMGFWLPTWSRNGRRDMEVPAP